jgi:pyrroline-5-carboxylate reductase
MRQLHIAFVGGGNMAEALIAGLRRAGHASENICVAEPQQERRAFLAEKYAIAAFADNALAAAGADVLVLAVKPQQMADVVRNLSAHLQPDASLISIAAGVTTASLRQWLCADANLIRVMPNTPAMIGAGMSVLFSEAGPEHQARAEYVMRACGETARVEDEKQMHAVTAVSGSGPAYFFLLAEIMQAAGAKLGLTEDLAARLALQTAYGAGKMLIESSHSAPDLRHQVTSPGGATQAALDKMYEMGLPAAVREGIVAACKRSEQMGDE